MHQMQSIKKTRRPPALGWFVGLCLCASMARPAAATVAVQRDFADLVARAEQVVVGTVTKIVADSDANGAPRTLVTFEDLSVLKGSVGSTLTLDFYGGRDGENATAIAEMPVFHEGERSVLFVAGNGSAICPLVGVWQGRFTVRTDPNTGAETVEASDGRIVVGRQRRALKLASPGAVQSPVTLDNFRQMVADELAQPAAE